MDKIVQKMSDQMDAQSRSWYMLGVRAGYILAEQGHNIQSAEFEAAKLFDDNRKEIADRQETKKGKRR